MKKYISLILICCLLLSAGCASGNNGEKDIKEEGGKESFSETADRIVNPDTNTVFAADLTRKGITGTGLDQVHLSALTLDKVKYYFPLVSYALDMQEWTVGDGDDKETLSTLLMNGASYPITVKNDLGIPVTVRGASADVTVFGNNTETLVTDIVLKPTAFSTQDWLLPGNITPKSTAADVVAAYGDPNHSTLFSDASYSTENELFYLEQVDSGLSYAFRFESDGTLAEAEISVKDEKVRERFLYKNDYISLSLPWFWRGRVNITQPQGQSCLCSFKEGDTLFSLNLLDRSGSIDVSGEGCNVIGTVSNGEKSYEVLYEPSAESDFPADFGPECISMRNCATSADFASFVQGGNDYQFSKADYSDYVGVYSESGEGEFAWWVDIIKASLGTVQFSYGYIAARAELVENTTAVLQHGEGRFEGRSTHGDYCEGTIRLADGCVYVDVPDSYNNRYTGLITDGELKLLRIKDEKVSSRPEGYYDEPPQKIKWFTLDLSLTELIGRPLQSLFDEYGMGSNSDNTLIIYKDQDIAFEPDDFITPDYDQRVKTVEIYGSHDLGGGIRSDMTYAEVKNTFPEVPPLSYTGEMTDVYYTRMTRDGYCYSFYWTDAAGTDPTAVTISK